MSFNFPKAPKPTLVDGVRVIGKQEKDMAKTAYQQGKSWEEIAQWLKCSVDDLYSCIPLKYYVNK